MWDKIKAWFKNSATIAWARISVIIGAAWTVLLTTDLSPVLKNPKLMTAWMIISGIATELARRRTLPPA